MRKQKLQEQEEAERQFAEQKRKEQEIEKRKAAEAKQRAQQNKVITTRIKLTFLLWMLNFENEMLKRNGSDVIFYGTGVKSYFKRRE